ncbi:RNA-directed DNA polymerase [Saltatorellus ferox]
MYAQDRPWQRFWRDSTKCVRDDAFTHIARVDIADFYNQIYHHSVENRLLDAGLPLPIIRTFVRFLGSLTGKVSRGVAVGPHATHLLAELSLDPVDRSLIAKGVRFRRFADDYHLYARSYSEAHTLILTLADALDRHQRLALQGQKSRIDTAEVFAADASILEKEQETPTVETVLRRVQRAHSESRAALILSSEEEAAVQAISEEQTTTLLVDAATSDPPELTRAAWILRALGQVRSSAALPFVFESLDQIYPILADVVRYVQTLARSGVYPPESSVDGAVALLDTDFGKYLSYVQLSLIALVAGNPAAADRSMLAGRYETLSTAGKREVILLAGGTTIGCWLTELKSDFGSMDPWIRRAFIASSPSMSGDEARFWSDSVKGHFDALENIVASEAFGTSLHGRLRLTS